MNSTSTLRHPPSNPSKPWPTNSHPKLKQPPSIPRQQKDSTWTASKPSRTRTMISLEYSILASNKKPPPTTQSTSLGKQVLLGIKSPNFQNVALRATSTRSLTLLPTWFFISFRTTRRETPSPLDSTKIPNGSKSIISCMSTN